MRILFHNPREASRGLVLSLNEPRLKLVHGWTEKSCFTSSNSDVISREEPNTKGTHCFNSWDPLLNYWAHKAYKTHGCVRPVHHLGEPEIENTPGTGATYVQSTQKSNDHQGTATMSKEAWTFQHLAFFSLTHTTHIFQEEAMLFYCPLAHAIPYSFKYHEILNPCTCSI